MKTLENGQKEPLVSIIIPIYNAQSTLERCLVSIRQQSWTNIEVILVDDGSTDHSAAICHKFTTKDFRFKYIYKTNSGVSETRNKGIAAASGEWIQFIDSDDWIPKEATETFVNAALISSCDMVISSFYRLIDKVKIQMGSINGNWIMTRESFASCMSDAPANFYYGVLWNKLYKAEIIHKNQIECSPHFKWCEDFLFNLEYLQFVSNVAIIDEPLYYYVKREDSITESQLTWLKTLNLRRELLVRYRELYKSLDLYNENKLKINSFLFAVATDTGESEYRKKKHRDVRLSLPGRKSNIRVYM